MTNRGIQNWIQNWSYQEQNCTEQVENFTVQMQNFTVQLQNFTVQVQNFTVQLQNCLFKFAVSSSLVVLSGELDIKIRPRRRSKISHFQEPQQSLSENMETEKSIGRPSTQEKFSTERTLITSSAGKLNYNQYFQSIKLLLVSFSLMAVPFSRRPWLSGSLMICGIVFYSGPYYYSGITGDRRIRKYSTIKSYLVDNDVTSIFCQTRSAWWSIQHLGRGFNDVLLSHKGLRRNSGNN